MNLATISQALIFTLLVHGMAIGSALTMIYHKESSGFIKSSMAAGVALSGLSVLTIFWALGSSVQSVSSRISLLILFHLTEFLVTGAGAVMGIVRPGHIMNTPLSGKRIMDPEDIKNVYKLRNGTATAALTALAVAVGLVFLLCFVFFLANDSLKALKRTGELPSGSLWAVTCGDGPTTTQEDDLEPDAEYGAMRKKKPTFQNRGRKVEIEDPDGYSSDEHEELLISRGKRGEIIR
jgi:hypothetical protein